MKITKEFLQELKMADEITIKMQTETREIKETNIRVAMGYVILTQEIERMNRKHKIHSDRIEIETVFSNYYDHETNYHCSYWDPFIKYSNSVWKAIIYFLKPDDYIKITFNHYENITVIYIEVTRYLKNKTLQFTFMIDKGDHLLAEIE